jgi:hypothetical protein
VVGCICFTTTTKRLSTFLGTVRYLNNKNMQMALNVNFIIFILHRRNVHTEKLHKFCHSPNIISVIKSWKMGWSRHVARRVMTNAHRILVGKYDRKIRVGRPIHRWKVNVKLFLCFTKFDALKMYPLLN